MSDQMDYYYDEDVTRQYLDLDDYVEMEELEMYENGGEEENVEADENAEADENIDIDEYGDIDEDSLEEEIDGTDEYVREHENLRSIKWLLRLDYAEISNLRSREMLLQLLRELRDALREVE
ncbi:hypothetical protein DACRYDRAFT_108776 [Dacryopinax primogenitus]|uniref:Uncharacterized protein n=1 Tax=Dacryopinax primogenitus (strain DJM 731) TaxID=1858805 RepID=M5FWG6_DACPD|nr:uncharacterized protein DACRYDRAFT_108776 [Dacryopinax primogenitus]EJU00709.1 hypothetical protein DACRYDRAFT_108776 [Dacryopinax primogenitus]